MENATRLFGLLAFFSALAVLAYFGCNNGDDDDDSSAETAVFYEYFEELDPGCPYGEYAFVVQNPGTCDSDGDEGDKLNDVSYPALAIVVKFDDEYELEQKHGPQEIRQVDSHQCYEGFFASVRLSDQADDFVYFKDGSVNIERLEDDIYRVEFSITFEDGSVEQGVWESELCGEPVPE